jgi:site-specific DNA recombinase
MTGHGALRLDNPKYCGQVEYLFSYGGKEVHVVQPGRHEAIVP